MSTGDLDPELIGWWRITHTSQWVDDGLDLLGPALLSVAGHGGRLRMHCLLATVDFRPTKAGASFTWQGAWECEQMTGTGSLKIGRDGQLRGRLKIRDGDESAFTAERSTELGHSISDPPDDGDKWGPGRRR